MFFSGDEDTGKVLCMAQVPKDIISGKGLKANEWCQQVQGIINGKGGGKPENAQASGTKPQVNEYARTTRILDGRNSQKNLHQTLADLLILTISHNLTQSLQNFKKIPF